MQCPRSILTYGPEYGPNYHLDMELNRSAGSLSISLFDLKNINRCYQIFDAESIKEMTKYARISPANLFRLMQHQFTEGSKGKLYYSPRICTFNNYMKGIVY